MLPAPPTTKRRFLQQGILTLLTRRGRALCTGETGYAWVPDDPLVGWLAAALYYFHEGQYIRLDREVEVRCQERFQFNRRRWSIWRDRLAVLQDDLRQDGIAVLPLKGAAYIEQIYPDEGLRPLKDVDVLVPEDRFLDAIKIMLDEGLVFQATETALSLDSFFKARPGEQPPSIALRDPVTQMDLKLHRKLLTSDWFYRGFALDIQQVWARKVANPRRDSLWSHFLSPYDTLAHLCVYQANHSLEMMIAFVDTDTWIRKRSASWDWGEFVRTVNQWHIRSATYHTLFYCQALMETPLPPNLLDQIDPGAFARQRIAWLTSPQVVLDPTSRSWVHSDSLVKLLLFDRFDILLKVAGGLLFPEKGWLQRRYGRIISLHQHWRNMLAMVNKRD